MGTKGPSAESKNLLLAGEVSAKARGRPSLLQESATKNRALGAS